MKEALTFNDVNIVPGFSSIPSRDEKHISLACKLGMKLPVISANMDTVTDQVMARAMLQNGAQACLHRFNSIEDNVSQFRLSFGNPVNEERPFVSIGLGDSGLERAQVLFDAGAKVFVIDVAHGAQQAVVDQASRLRQIVKNNALIVVGNFASCKSLSGFNFKDIDAIKVGVGPGAACTTRIKTGVGVPQFTAIQEISNYVRGYDIVIIADGGLKTSGDIAKALGAGADCVMVGSMLAGTDETPGEVVSKQDGPIFLGIQSNNYYKKYRGSASQESYELQGKVAKHRTAEGESFLVKCKGPVADVLQGIDAGLRSSFAYVGASNLDAFHERVEFVRVTHNGYVEGTAHGKKD